MTSNGLIGQIDIKKVMCANIRQKLGEAEKTFEDGSLGINIHIFIYLTLCSY